MPDVIYIYIKEEHFLTYRNALLLGRWPLEAKFLSSSCTDHVEGLDSINFDPAPSKGAIY